MRQSRSSGHLVDGMRLFSLRAPLVSKINFVGDEKRCVGGVLAAGNNCWFMLTTIVFRVERVCSLS